MWYLLIALLLWIPILALLFMAIRHLLLYDVRRSRAELDQKVRNLKSGASNTVRLYDTVRTDALLKQIRCMPQVEELNLDQTDVSDKGMRHVATLRNLKKLVVYDGRPGIGDLGLARLKGHGKLESLELVLTRVTDEGLVVLKDLPKLRSLVLYSQPRLGPLLTDAGLVHLEGLTRLETLELTGGWASEPAVEDLRKALPNCTIDTKRVR